MILKVYMPPQLDRRTLFQTAVEERIQVRQFLKSQTSLEDVFAKAVGVD
jgi:hypothetical protein